jgi:lipopolysaccharide biosynthesis glycosyltransferase
MIQVFIGYDTREAVAFSVLAHSIHAHASMPVSIAPLMLSQLRHILTRARDPRQSTDFAFSRFLTPYLSAYSGWSIFMDCDMLMLDDIAKLWRLRDDRYAVMVVKHDHQPRESVKFLGQQQIPYPKKNWSSVMLFNNARCRALTPGYVNTAGGLELHQFKWLAEESLIGELPRRWNYLVGYDEYGDDNALIHYTLGGPYFAEYRHCDYADMWRRHYERMISVSRRETEQVLAG